MKKIKIIIVFLLASFGVSGQVALWQIEYALGQDSMIISQSDGELIFRPTSAINLSLFNDDLTHTTNHWTLSGSDLTDNYTTVGINGVSTGAVFMVNAANSTFEVDATQMRHTSLGTSAISDVLITDKDNNSARAALDVKGNNGLIDILFAASNGLVEFGTYGAGTFTGTPTYYSAWDASGNFIERTLAEMQTAIDTDTNLSQEEVEDFAGGMVTGNTETLITVTYQDADGTIDYVVDPNLSNYVDDLGYTVSLWVDNGTYTATVDDTQPIQVHSISNFTGTNLAWWESGTPSLLGDYNIQIGSNAGNDLEAGAQYNNLIGYRAGYDITTGDNNVMIGQFAGGYHTTGIGNFFLGYRAGMGQIGLSVASNNNIAFGYLALTDITTGDENIALGYTAAENLTSGAYNVVLGRGALQLETDRSYNVALGYEALGNSLGGQGNVALGYQAGEFLTTGDYNVFLGYDVANAGVATGNQNIAIGRASAQSLTSAHDNIFMGYLSGNKQTSGHFNVAAGYNAGYYGTTQQGNVYLGYQAGKGQIGLTTTSNYNVGVGYLALSEITTGDDNIALGRDAGKALTTESSNVFIGMQSGKINTGSGSVFIGSETGENETGSNLLYVDNSNTVDPVIYGDFSANTLEFNVNELLITTKDIGATTDVQIKLENDGGAYLMGLNTFGDLTFSPTSSVDDIQFTDVALNNIMVIDVSDDEVGINTTSPLHDLDVNGDVRIQAGLYDSNSSNGDAGDIAVSDGTNIDWRDNPAGSMYHSASQTSISSSTQLQFNTVLFESGDGINMDNISDEIDISIAGTYQISFSCNATGFGKITAKNNGILDSWFESIYIQFTNSTVQTQNQTIIMELAASDNLEFFAESTSGTVDIKEAKVSITRIR